MIKRESDEKSRKHRVEKDRGQFIVLKTGWFSSKSSVGTILKLVVFMAVKSA